MPTTTSLTPTVYANYHSASLKLDFVDDTWESSSVTVTGRVLVGGNWHDIHDLLLDDAGADTYWGRIFGLDEGTNYRVEFTWIRTASDDGETLETVTSATNFTTRSSPQSADSSFIYIAPGGNDTTGTGAYHKPYRTLSKAASVLGSGGTIIMKNGTYGPSVADGAYDWASVADGDITGLDGTANAYKTIRAETPGAVLITGRRLVEIAQGSWTQHADNVFRADFSSYMDTSGKSASIWLRKESDSTFKYLYGDLTDGQDTGIGTLSWEAIEDGTREGFVYDWTNNRIYVRTTGNPATKPATNAYSTGWHKGEALDFVHCDYVILEGITFEMFGSVAQRSGGQYLSQLLALTHSKRGVRLYNCTNFVIRNCTFNQTTVANGSGSGQTWTAVTIEDCEFAGHDWWTQLYATPMDVTTGWNYVKNTPNEDFTVMSQAGDATSQIVIRRCTWTGCDDGLSLDLATGNNHFDIYQNTFTRMFDGAAEVNGSGCVVKNGAFWHNTFTNCLLAFRITPLASGPVWLIGNYGTDCGVFNCVYSAATVDGADSNGWLLAYNNTLLTSTPLDPLTGYAWALGFGAGRQRLTNNILSHPANYIGDVAGGLTSYSHENILTTNCFYSPSADADWIYDGLDKGSEAAYIAATAGDMSLSGNVYVDPYPDGTSGALLASLKTAATPIKGITTIAGNSAGVPHGPKLPLGRFETWAYPAEVSPPEPTQSPVPGPIRIEVSGSVSLRVN